MSNSVIFDINVHDGTEEIARKCNYNFRQISSALESKSSQAVREESDRADGIVAEAKTEINAALEDAKATLRNETANAVAAAKEEINTALNQAKADLKAYVDQEVAAANARITALGDPVTIAHGGTGKNERTAALKALGVNWGTSAPAATGTANSFYIQVL